MPCHICGGTGKVICSMCGGTGVQTTKAYGVTGLNTMSGPCPLCSSKGLRPCNCGIYGFAMNGTPLHYQTAKLTHNDIVPFKHINGIVPRETSIRAVVKFFGKPDSGHIGSPTYRRYGFALGVKDGTVVYVTAASPFHGRTSNGLYIGLDATIAKKICDNEYILINKGVEEFWVYRMTGEVKLFKLAVRGGALCAMTVE